MSGKRFQGEKAKKNGFYIALGVCLVAVGIAAWSTYDAVDSYTVPSEPTEEVGTSTVSKPESSERTSKYQAKKDDGENLNRSEKQSEISKVESSKVEEPTKENKKTDVEVAGETEVESEAVDGEVYQENEIPANAGLYEISEIISYPVESKEIISAYSNGMPVYSNTMKDWRVHTGIDFKAESGEVVKACANGMVSEVIQDTMLGNVVVVEHGEHIFYYCGLGENIELAEGDTVSVGDIIGVVSSVPFESAEEAHLHLEVKRDNVYLNPEDILSENQG